MATLETRQTPPPGARLNRKILMLGAVLLGGLILGVMYVKAHLHLPSISLMSQEVTAPPPLKLPDMLGKVRTYAELAPPAPKERPPVATPLPRLPSPPVATPPPEPPPAPVPVQKADVALPDFLTQWQRQEQLAQRVPPPVATPPAPAPKPEKPPRKAWLIESTTMNLKEKEVKPGSDKDKEAPPVASGAQLIKPATWARPAKPLLTLYRSQSLAGRTLDAINSDIPGQVRIELTVPVFDKFGADQEILPKGALVIAMQEGKATYGQSRLNLRLEQIELPTSEVISLKAAIGDQDGASGVGGKVNNHYVKLGLAAGISAILNIGVKAAAGTPGANLYYQNPVQSAAQDLGQSIQRDAQSVVDRELRVPPTITIPAGTFCTVNLGDNVTFTRKPYIQR